MMKFLIAILLVVFSFPATAKCPVSDFLIHKYGISFSGFEVEIPKIPNPRFDNEKNGDLILVKLLNEKGFVPDGFFHSAVISLPRKMAWIHRTGGFLSVNEWYGPVELVKVDLSGCGVERYKI